jgi:hypothetical protein
MGNPYRGEASFDALGESWTLRFNTNALCEFEEASGVKVSAIGAGMGFKELRALLWAGLGHHHRRKRGTLESVGAMMDEIGAQELAALVMKAMTSAFPAKDGDAESPPQAAQTEDGSTS